MYLIFEILKYSRTQMYWEEKYQVKRYKSLSLEQRKEERLPINI